MRTPGMVIEVSAMLVLKMIFRTPWKYAKNARGEVSFSKKKFIVDTAQKKATKNTMKNNIIVRFIT